MANSVFRSAQTTEVPATAQTPGKDVPDSASASVEDKNRSTLFR
jgi:hypothetical protein